MDYQKEVFARWIFVNFKINLFKYKHVVFRYFSKLDNLNVTLSKSDLSRVDSVLDFFFPKNHIFKLSYLPPSFSKGFLCFCIGGQHFTKKIPVQKIISICKKIHYPIILIGGQEEKNNGDIIKSEVDQLIFNACGKSLLDSATIIKTSKGVLSPDTGMMHIATALNKKTITIWGGTTPELGFSSFSNFSTYNIDELVKENSEDINLNRNIDIIQRISCQPCSRFGRSKCPLGHHQCMENISENKVTSYLKYW